MRKDVEKHGAERERTLNKIPREKGQNLIVFVLAD